MLEKTPSNRFPSLDGWRAVGILLVMFSHVWAADNYDQTRFYFHHLASQGDLGVRIFFVLSGFLISYLLLVEYERTGAVSLKDFYIRRVLRIFPVYFLYLFVLVLLQAAGLYHETFSSWLGVLTFTRNMTGHGQSATAHFWSLAVEEQFYLAWPIALVAFGLYRRPRLALWVLAAVALTSVASRIVACEDQSFLCQRILNDKSTIKYADSIAVGCMAAFLAIKYRFKERYGVALFYVALAALVLSAATQSMVTNAAASSVLIAVQALLIIVCIVLSITAKPFGVYQVLNSRPFVILGHVSYSLYVWHVMFLSHYMGNRPGSAIYDWRVWWIPAVLVAVVSFYAFERPIVGLRKKN